MSSFAINRETILKNLETLASEENIKDLQPGADGSTLELKSSWGHREVSSQQHASESQEKVQKIIGDTLKFAEHFQNTDVCLTESEACSLSRIMYALHDSLPLCADATDEQRARKNLLLSIFHKSAMAGLRSESALSPALSTSLYICDSLLLNQSLSKDIAPIVIKVAEAGLKTSKKMYALYLLKGLVNQGLNFEMACQAAVDGMKDPVLQEASLGILTALVRKGQSFDIAITAAKQGLSNENPSVRLASLGLMLILLERGQGVEEAHAAALQVAKDQDILVRRSSLALFKVLFTLNQGFDSTTLRALEGLHSSEDIFINPNLELAFLEIYKILVEKGYAYETATQFATEALEKIATNAVLREGGVIDLLKALDNNRVQPEEWDWARRNINIKDPALEEVSLGILTALVDKGYVPAYDFAIAAVKKYLKSNTHSHETAAANLFKALCKQGKGLDEGIELSSFATANSREEKSSDEVLKAAQATQIKTLEFKK